MKTFIDENPYNRNVTPETAIDLVEQYGGDPWGASGQVESLATQVHNTRKILGRLIQTLADKNLLTDSEVLSIIRG